MQALRLGLVGHLAFSASFLGNYHQNLPFQGEKLRLQEVGVVPKS